MELQRIFILMMHFNVLIPSCPTRAPNKICSVHPSTKKDHQSRQILRAETEC